MNSIGLAAFVLAAAASAAADDGSMTSGGVTFGGRFSTAIHLGMDDCSSPSSCRLLNFRNSNVFGLTVQARPSRTVDVQGGVLVRNTNFARIESLEQTGEITEVQPVDIRALESKILLTELFGAKGLELSAGMLRVAWGTADGVSPTDIVNPYDLEAGAGFGARLPSLAVAAAYEAGDFRVEVTWLPLFQPAILPVDAIDVTTLGDPSDVFDLGEYAQGEPPAVRQVDTPTTTPTPSVDNFAVAARVRYRAPIGDLSLMFFRGHESLPQASGEARLSGFQTSNRVDLGVPLVFPRLMMAGLDWRGPIGGPVSGWIDLGVFFPQAAELKASRSQLEALVKLGRLSEVPNPIPVQSTQSSDVYVKTVAGIDMTLAEVVYVNVQYAYGLPFERQRSDEHHYALALTRVSLLDDRLSLTASGALEVSPDADLGFSAGGEIAWTHGDAARLALAVTMVGGQPGSSFGRLEKLSCVTLSVETQF